MATVAQPNVCPVVGTTNSILPPTHPDVDLDKPDQVCPVTKATTNHHHNLHKHPSVPADETTSQNTADASACPALKNIVNQPQSQQLDDKVCPVVGPVTTILPPDHPSTANAKDGDVCPVTNASVAHHKGKVHQHPQVADAPKGAVCPVVGAQAS